MKEIYQVKSYLLEYNDPRVSDILKNENILGVIEYASTDSCFSFYKGYNIPYSIINMKNFFNEESYIEIWTSSSKVSYGVFNNIKYANDGENLFACISEIDKETDMEILGEIIYDKLFNMLDMSKYRNVYRIWNYMSNITGLDYKDRERYKTFCSGRSISYEKNKINNNGILPAATCIGDESYLVNVFFLFSLNLIGNNIENPNQVPAYIYPKQYGNKSPLFSRATYCSRKNNHFELYISGTASIVGHNSVFIDNPEKQCLQIFENLKSLISKENLLRYGIKDEMTLRDLDCVKVYIKNKKDYHVIREICSYILNPEAFVAYFEGNVCRGNLLVEIEALILR